MATEDLGLSKPIDGRVLADVTHQGILIGRPCRRLDTKSAQAADFFYRSRRQSRVPFLDGIATGT
jgi:hypothetical protein